MENLMKKTLDEAANELYLESVNHLDCLKGASATLLYGLTTDIKRIERKLDMAIRNNEKEPKLPIDKKLKELSSFLSEFQSIQTNHEKCLLIFKKLIDEISAEAK